MTAPRAAARSAHDADSGPVLNIHHATETITSTARRDPAAALAELNAIVAAGASARLGHHEGDGFSAWSRPAAPDDAPGDALAALASGGRLQLAGRQPVWSTGEKELPTALIVPDRDVRRGGYLVLLDAGAYCRTGDPIFGRLGFHLDEIEFPTSFAVSRFTSISEQHFEQTLAWVALLEEYLHAALDHGLLQGFWAAAHEHITTRTRPWQGQSLAKATDDPHLTRRYGEYVTIRHALDELMGEARDALAAAEDTAGLHVTAQARDAVAAARQFASHAGRITINGTIELLGAGATSERFGFDLFWREFTAHAVSNPPRWSFEAIGRALLTSPSTEPNL